MEDNQQQQRKPEERKEKRSLTGIEKETMRLSKSNFQKSLSLSPYNQCDSITLDMLLSSDDNLFSNSDSDSEHHIQEEFYYKIRSTKKIIPKPNFMQKKEKIKIIENIEQIDQKIMTDNILFDIINSLKKHFVFFALNQEQLEEVVYKMFPCKTKKGEFVFQQGNSATLFFFIESGEVSVYINNELKKKLKQNDCFGELALLYDAPRSASILVEDCECVFWAIDGVTFRKLNEQMNQKYFTLYRVFLEKVYFFQSFTKQQRDALASAFSLQKFQNGEIIVSKDDAADSFYIIKEGYVGIVDENGQQVGLLQQGEWFGETALLSENAIRQMNAYARTNIVVLLALSRKQVKDILGDKIKNIAFRNLQRWAFQKDPILNKLLAIQREKIYNAMTIRKVLSGDQIINENTFKTIGVILEGRLQKQEDLEKSTAFGSECLTNLVYNPNFQVVAITDSIIAEISKQKLESIIGGTYQEILPKNRGSHEHSQYFSSNSNSQANSQSNSETEIEGEEKEQDDVKKIKLEKFIYIKLLGQGQYGSVHLVQLFKKQRYAIKAMLISFIIEHEVEEYLLNEKRVQLILNFPFIMKYYRSFADRNFIYFLNEYINGVSLLTVMKKIGLLNKKQSQFYIGTIILVLQHLHTKGVVYRDLKPENIMVDQDGYIKLVDLGTAKSLYVTNNNNSNSNIIKDQREESEVSRTYTIIGTPHYMAPEIILQKGYTFPVDYWSLGVCLYEYLCGFLPFGPDLDDPYQIYESILKGQIRYPKQMDDKAARSIIEQLLSKAPEVRLGGSFGALKAHVWFDDFDWDNLFNKQMEPPYVPSNQEILNDQQIEQLAAQNQNASLTQIMLAKLFEQGKYHTKSSFSQAQQDTQPEWINQFKE